MAIYRNTDDILFTLSCVCEATERLCTIYSLPGMDDYSAIKVLEMNLFVHSVLTSYAPGHEGLWRAMYSVALANMKYITLAGLKCSNTHASYMPEIKELVKKVLRMVHALKQAFPKHSGPKVLTHELVTASLTLVPHTYREIPSVPTN